MNRKSLIVPVIIVLTSVVVLGVLVTAAGAWWMLKDVRPAAGPVPRYRELVVIECDAGGRVQYRVGEKTVASEEDLTAELRSLTPRREFRKGAGIEVEFVIVSVATAGADPFTQEHLDRAKAACQAAGAKVVAPKQPLPARPVTVALEVNAKGRTQYRIAGGEAIATEEALRQALAELVRTRNTTTVRLHAEPLSGITEGDLAAAKAACRAAGIAVDSTSLPPTLPGNMAAVVRAGERRGSLKVHAVGVRDGALQFRVDGGLVEGNERLTSAVRRRIAQIEEEKGGFTSISPTITYAPELVLSSEQCDAVSAAVSAAGDQMSGSFGYRDGGGIKSNVLKPVTVNIVAPHADGNRYQIASRAVDGEKALVAALGEELAEWRRGKTVPKVHFLLVSIQVEVRPGVTATEEQIELAHRTVDSAGVQRPPDLNVVVTISGTGDRGTRYAIAEKVHEGDDALKEAVRALADQTGKDGKRLVVQLEVAPDAGTGAGAIDAAAKACLEAGAAVQAPAQKGR